MLKGASAVRATGILIMNKLNKCTLSILVFNLFLDRHQYFRTLVSLLSSWNMCEFSKNTAMWLGLKNSLDTKTFVSVPEINLSQIKKLQVAKNLHVKFILLISNCILPVF